MTTATVKTNIWGVQVGDVLSFTNSVNYPILITVKRVEEKSWYGGQGRVNGRNSYGTLQRYAKYPDFKIIKATAE